MGWPKIKYELSPERRGKDGKYWRLKRKSEQLRSFPSEEEGRLWLANYETFVNGLDLFFCKIKPTRMISD